VASNTRELNNQALESLETILGAHLIASTELDWERLKQEFSEATEK
jgi:hypothetical protein